jgi:uncharacterized protein YndB with AHSA1/START domain
MRITMSHSIEIDASPEEVFAFFVNLEENYTRWHPNHNEFRWIKGEAMHEGSVAFADQMGRGKSQRQNVRIDRVEPNRRIEFSWTNPLVRFLLPRNVWVFEPANGGCRFTAESDVRLGWISSRMTHVRKGLEEGRVHLKEEGENLKRLIEEERVREPR